MAKKKIIIDAHVDVQIKRIVFYTQDTHFCVLSCEVIKEYEDSKPLECINPFNGYITITGRIVLPKVDEQYEMKLAMMEHPRYGKQYTTMLARNLVNTASPEGQRSYLESIFTELQVANLYATLDDPYKALEERDIPSLVLVPGVGFATAEKLLKKFNDKKFYSMAYGELKPYGLTDYTIEAIVDHYQSLDYAIKLVTERPYQLVLDQIPGIGWKKTDAIAKQVLGNQITTLQIKAFIFYYLKVQGEQGDSYVLPSELRGAIEENIGLETPELLMTEAIHELQDEDQIWCDKEHTKIGLMKYYELEENIAKELLRIRDGDNNFKYNDWHDKVKTLEEEQGIEYTEEQVAGIKKALDEQVVFITGKAGSGKTSIANALISVLKDKYTYAQCALSGKAAQRLAEVTGDKGYTIHRLLGYAPATGFIHNKDNPLPYDIIILDELSMVDGYLFYRLISSIKTGTKLIMLGDVAQLPPIGMLNIANDILHSQEISTVTLTKIHRQAAQSGIITESIKVSEGTDIISKDYVGKTTKGLLEDFHIDSYTDKSNTFYKIVEHVNIAKEKGISVDDIQVIVPMKTRGNSCVYVLNNTLQEIWNPKKEGDIEVDIRYDNERMYSLRVHDKVVNRVNNYGAMLYNADVENEDNDEDEDNKRSPITAVFNGNMGKVTKIISPHSLVVDFTGIGEVVISGRDVNNLELAYAVTCHVFQGSQVDNVIVGLDYSAFNMLSKQWVYTALTRAKKDCILCCQNSALRYATRQNHILVKHTHLKELLYSLAHPVWRY